MQHTDVGIDHPIAIEILGLRDALAQQQHATQQAVGQINKHALDTLAAVSKARQLATENATLQDELDLLRRPRPDPSPTPTEAELTLALRRANARLEDIQSQLLESNTSATHAYAERERTEGEVAEAYRLLEAARQQEVALRASLAERDAEKRTYELALGEYAALVRDLEKREGDSSVSLNVQLAATGQVERVKELTTELARARSDIESLQAQLGVERHASEAERVRLAEVRTELGKREADDRSAAALVERYMKFSQHHTDILQRALSDQSSRHSATLASFSQHAKHMEHTLNIEKTRTRQLQSALDSLVEDLARESSGRRREVRLRLAIASRMAKIEEELRRWERRIREHPSSQDSSGEATSFTFGLQDIDQFRAIVDSLGAPIIFRDTASSSSEDDSLSGPLARVLAAEIAVEGLTAELERETARRVELERERAKLPSVPVMGEPQPKESEQKQSPQDSSTVLSSVSVSLSSLHNNSDLSLVTSETSVSLNETSVGPFLPSSITDVSQALESSPPDKPPPLPITPVASPPKELPSQESPPTEPPTSIVPFPVRPESPLSLEQQAPTEPQSLYDSSEVQELLAQLPVALQRYTSFQNALRDCHLTLSALKSELRQKPRTHLLSAVERLDDYNEDTRVEVEIRIADEARKANGFEAMLHLSPSSPSQIVAELRAFVDGSAPDIQKALETAKRKRDDLEHDIAAIKLAVHAPENEDGSIVTPPSPMWGRQPFPSGAVSAPAPSLGSVGFPLLRKVASGTFGHSRASSLGGNEAIEHPHKDPFAGLGLRIPMPVQQSFSSPSSALPSPMKPSYHVGSTLILERTRATSMYFPGLGRSRPGLDPSARSSMSVTPTSKLEEEGDDDVE